jgi:hypothetical protein
MLRIIIEIDGDNVAVHTDRSMLEPDSASIVDAGSAPAELLRDFGGLDDRTVKVKSPRGKRGAAGTERETPLNPLRAGEAIARQLLGQVTREDSEALETIDAGSAPKKLSKISRKKQSPNQRARTRRKAH